MTFFEPGDIIKYNNKYYVVIEQHSPHGEAKGYPVYKCRGPKKEINIDSYDAIIYYHHGNSDIDKKLAELKLIFG